MATAFDEPDPMLDDHINKCRCCFRTLLGDQNSVKISKAVEQKFLDLTGLELIQTDVFSAKICQLCDKDLDVFHNFRRDLVQKQRKLYSSVLQPADGHETMILKTEANEFIDCNPTIAEVIECSEEFIDCAYEVKEFEGSGEEMRTLTRSLSQLPKEQLLSMTTESRAKSSAFQCDKCNFEASQKQVLEKHVKVHVRKESLTLYCEICGLSFGKRHLLNRHVKIKHTIKERRYRCTSDNCDKAFFTISLLKKHAESHSEKALPCEYCGKLFSCLNNLRTHLYYHAEPKFACDFEGCGKKFFMRKLLKAHINVHRGQKDFRCEFCEKSYFFQAHLKRHVISMHMRLKIDCELCASSFARKETYRNHVINHHQNLGADDLEKLLAKIRQMKVEDYRCTT